MWPGSHGVVVNPQEGLMECSVFDMDPYVNPYVDFRGVALNPGCSFLGYSSGGHIPIDPRLMPANGLMPQSILPYPYAQSNLISQPPIYHHENDNAGHLVRSQTRIGILPGATGRLAAPTPGSAAAKVYIPHKNADGRFVCTTLSFLCYLNR
jgi:hypothetical protein